jgi:hypothetical protein
MNKYQMTHQVRDGTFGVLNALFGIGTHRVEIRDDKGVTIGRGTGRSEASAREQAWKDVHKQERAEA